MKPKDLARRPRPPGSFLSRVCLGVFHPKERRLKAQTFSLFRRQKSCHVPPLDGEVFMRQEILPKGRGGGSMNVGHDCQPGKDQEKKSRK